ncbi:dienelactone hydrolase family protein [Sphingomonas naphthae]|uniref:Dienelactone hydrolase family protein n=1 Tax=Sphingomonas naphthae TaxID=1813468 RepID=A0ABY7TJS0_9SPHN|nr:dienelactone hydrolase family protein [Sphingomonas naphthae]WCT72655.1 dienelactone hydrolase family protein [Sphingomonas naphthae]
MSAQPWIYSDGDLELRGELFQPTATPNGAFVLVVHEADGIGGNVREHSGRLAGLGYLVAAADMHGGGRVLDGAEMADALTAFRTDPDLLRRRVRAAFDAFSQRPDVDPGRLAAIGFCFGGMTVLELARSGAPVRAVASFHGLLTTAAPARPGDVHARILAATGARDPLVPSEDVAAFQREMTEAGADWHLLVHGRALHSYTNHAVDGLSDERMAYDPAAHRLSWATLTCFLGDALLEPDVAS